MLLGTLGASLLENLLTGNGLYRTEKGMYRSGNGMYRSGNVRYRTGQGLKKKLIPFHPLSNFEIMDYFKDVKRFNGVFSRDNSPKLKNGVYAINLDHSKNTGTHWAVILMKKDEVIYFDNFCVEYIPKEIMKRIKHKNI